MGIRYKLLIAFVLVLSTTLLASAISYSAFSHLSHAVMNITRERVPMMASGMEMGKMGTELAKSMSLLASAKTHKERLESVNNSR